MLLPRILSAVILAPLFLLLVHLGTPWFNVLIGVIAAIMAAEFARMDGEGGTKRRLLISTACVAAVIAMSVDGWIALAVVVFFTISVFGADQVTSRRGLSLVHAAVPYIALPALSLLYVRAVGDAVSIYWLLAVVWGTDIGAYAFGRLIGGPKLAPAISPKKTWSGAVGGLFCGIGASAAVLAGFDLPIGPVVILVALVVSVATQVGDLLESGLKRWYEVKDSGTLIPGHGGLMDRFDGLWAAAPLAALFCGIFSGGVDQW